MSPASHAGRSPTDAPGWIEVVVGLLCLSVVAIGGGLGLVQLRMDAAVLGLILAGLSGIGGLAGFFAAFFVRLRSWEAFGIRRTSRRWIAMGIAAGIIAFLVKSAAILIYVYVTGDDRTPQDIYAKGASTGIAAAIAATLFLSVLTPIGEEFLFRGVVTTALLRCGRWTGVGGSALIFAIFHGANMVFPAAIVAGLFAAEIFRRSGSVWPAVAVHIVINLPTIPVMLLAGVGD